MIREREHYTAPGLLMIVLFLAVLAGAVAGVVHAAQVDRPLALVGFALLALADVVAVGGLFTVAPNEGQVLQLFGAYRGTVKQEGLRWANPFYTKRRVSLRVRNFESTRLKVNDTDGNPIEIAAIVVWRVIDTAEAKFEVDDYENYVKVQTESAVRNLATHYPYDAHVDGQLSLRGSTDEVAKGLKREIQDRLSKAGVEVIEARISHLAYAPEIAAAMLRRQQAGAIIAARQRIVEGAVGMVEMALDLLAQSGKVQLDEERKAAMVSNLLVVLCADREAQPVVNAGTLYH
ncbi:MAG TPA: SPFH domain-containing protein [Vicinamibacteria bacterium]|nr:SPFH domain-containing protein [Vicinamibacteria bacterium]